MRFCLLLLVLFTLLAASGCSTFLIDAGASLPAHAVASYDPQAPSVETPLLSNALAGARWLTAGDLEVTALGLTNRVDEEVLAALVVDGDSRGLTIRSNAPLQSAALYVRYDAGKLHPLQVDGEREGAISLAARIEPGIFGIGVAAIGDGTLDPGLPLATLSFAPGADSELRSVSIKHIPNNIVPDLVAVDNVNSTATLSWSERNVGDYNQDKQVTISDITPLGANLGKTPASPDWTRAELADGDFNSNVNISDLTPLGANLGATIEGYDVFRTVVTGPTDDPDPSDTGRWTKVENQAEPAGPSAPRDFNGQQVRLTYTFIDDSGIGEFAWYVRAVAGASDGLDGPPSVVAKQTVTPAGPPPAGLSFEIQAPATEFATVNDEFYIAIKVTEVVDLFSANVRFEYDGSILEFVEGVPAYNDGTDHPNFLEPPLFVAVDDVDSAASPYVLLGFNATQTQGTPPKTGTGYLGYFKFKAIAPGIVAEAFRFPQSSNFIYLWGPNYGEPAALPALGGPQLMNIAP